MKKSNLLKITNLLIAVLFVALLGTLTACGDDDDKNAPSNPNPGTPSETTASIVGTWKLTYSSGNYETMTFKKDGTGVGMEVSLGDDPDIWEFTWSLKGNILTIVEEDSYYGSSNDVDKFEIVSLDANKLVLRELGEYDDDDYTVWTRQ